MKGKLLIKLLSQLLVVLFINICSSSISAQTLNGAYTIGASEGTDYSTITDAITDLATSSITGAVTFTVETGTYNETIDFRSINNGNHIITFEGANQETTIIQPTEPIIDTDIQAGIVGVDLSNFVFKNFTMDMEGISDETFSFYKNATQGFYISEASNIEFENLTLINANTTEDSNDYIGSSIYLYDTENITISSCEFSGALSHIRFDEYDQITISDNHFEKGYNSIAYIQDYMPDGSALTGGTDLVIQKNTLTGGRSGIYLEGLRDDGNKSTNSVVHNNHIEDTEFAGIYIVSVDSYDVTNNEIVGTDESEIGIYLSFNETGRIEKNEVYGPKLAISVDNLDKIEVINNILVGEYNALQLVVCADVTLIHNTFSSNNAGTLNYRSDGTYWVIPGDVISFYENFNNLFIVNNIFDGVEPMDLSTNAGIEISEATIGNMVLDYNLYSDILGSPVGFHRSTVSSPSVDLPLDEFNGTLTEWFDFTGLDENSMVSTSTFIAEGDYHIDNGANDHFGTYLSDVTEDIDGEIRVESVGVDVGADQYCETILEAIAIASCVSYTFEGTELTTSGEYEASFPSENGCDSLVTLTLTILEPTSGNDIQTALGSYDWNGTIYSISGAYDQTLTNLAGCDSTATLNLNIEPLNLGGNYTIGPSDDADYFNFTEAIADLQFATLTDNIAYSIEPGTYYDKLKLSAIPNGDFSITFSGADRESTIIHPLDGIDHDGSGISIENSNNIILENFTLEMDEISSTTVGTTSNSTKGIAIENASNIAIQNLSLKNESETYAVENTSNFIATGVSLISVADVTITSCSFSMTGVHNRIADFTNVTISDNSYSDARYNIRLDGSSGTGLLVENNTMTGPFDYSIYLKGKPGSNVEEITIQNNSLDVVDYTNSDYKGIYLNRTSGAMVTNNLLKTGSGIIVEYGNSTTIKSNEIFAAYQGQALIIDGTTEIDVYNNFFHGEIEASYPKNLKFINNTVKATNVSGSRPTAVNLDIYGDCVVQNNIFYADDSYKKLLYLFIELPDGPYTIDHNLYYSNSVDQLLIKYYAYYEDESEVSGFYDNLVDWQADQSDFDQNSQSFNPTFEADNDLHVTSADYRFGTYLEAVTKDIDGDARDEATGVDVGADQYCVRYDEVVDIESCDSYEFDGIELIESGQYQASFLSTSKCDSLVTLNFTILEPTSSILTESACESYEWNGLTYAISGSYQKLFTNAEGCDSTAFLNLVILEATSGEENIESCDNYEWNEFLYSVSGTYEEMLTNSVGCDSIATLNLTILESSNSEESIETCERFDWNGTRYTSSGIYQELFANSVGCDSTAVLNLIILEPSSSENTVDYCEKYTWNGETYTTSGIYEELFTNAVGCDSTAALHLTILESTNSEETEESCESYDWNGMTYNTSDTYEELFTNAAGCDSTAILNLTILEPTFSEEIVESCENYEWNDETFTTSGIYREVLVNSAGCDSTATLNLTILSKPIADVELDGSMLFVPEQEGVSYQWIDCSTSEPLPEETQHEFTPPHSGSYFVEVSNENCTAISDCIEAVIIATVEIPSTEITFYPNPTRKNVTIDFGLRQENVTVEVLNVAGMQLATYSTHNTNKMTVDLGDREGIYFIRIFSSDEYIETLKVIKK